MYAFHPGVLDEIGGPPPRDIGYDLLPRLVGRAKAMPVEGYFRDIGTIDAYQRAQREWPVRAADMIITQTPLRIGLLGGGTDLPDYYREHGGRVLNCAIDKYIYVIVKQRFDDDIYVNYSKKEIVSRVEDLEHELVREAMWMTGVTNGVEITTLADIPSAGGSGLGSSSAVTVGLLHALFAYRGRQVTAEELADRACTIEIDRCGKPIGKQDQYIAAYGGHPGHPLRARRSGGGRRAGAARRPRAGTCSGMSCCSIRESPGARTRSWPSRPPTSKPPVISLTSCATSPAWPPIGCAAGM